MPPGLAAWAPPTATGLLALLVISIIFGWLVPVSTLKRELAEAEKRAERDKQTIDTLQKRGDMLADMLREMIPYARNADQLMQELRRRLDREAP
jgi:hypothetical protein